MSVLRAQLFTCPLRSHELSILVPPPVSGQHTNFSFCLFVFTIYLVKGIARARRRPAKKKLSTLFQPAAPRLHQPSPPPSPRPHPSFCETTVNLIKKIFFFFFWGGGGGLRRKYIKMFHPPTLASERRSCVKVEVAVLGSPSLIVLMVSVDVKRL